MYAMCTGLLAAVCVAAGSGESPLAVAVTAADVVAVCEEAVKSERLRCLSRRACVASLLSVAERGQRSDSVSCDRTCMAAYSCGGPHPAAFLERLVLGDGYI